MCIRHSHKGSIVKVTSLSLNITEENRKQQNQCDDNLQNKFSYLDNSQDNIKMDSNPSYGPVQSCNTVTDGANTHPNCNVTVTIQTNPSYNSISKKVSKDEDQSGYVEAQANFFNTDKMDYLKLTVTGNVKTNPNQSYDLVSGGVILEDNPSYNKVKHA